MKKDRTIDACSFCSGKRFRRVLARHPFPLGGRIYEVVVPKRVCVKCGEGYLHFNDVRAGAKRVAAELARKGPVTSAGFKFMRQAIELHAVELARRLGVTPGTVSRWENAAGPVDRAAWMTLGSIVLDTLEGKDETLERLRSLDEPAPRGTIRVDR